MAKLTMKSIKEENFDEVMSVVVKHLDEFSTESMTLFVGDNVQFNVYRNPKGDLFVKGVS